MKSLMRRAVSVVIALIISALALGTLAAVVGGLIAMGDWFHNHETREVSTQTYCHDDDEYREYYEPKGDPMCWEVTYTDEFSVVADKPLFWQVTYGVIWLLGTAIIALGALTLPFMLIMRTWNYVADHWNDSQYR